MKNYADRGGCTHWPRWIIASEIWSIILHVIRKPNSIIISLFIRNISKLLPSLPSRRLTVMFCYSWICPFSFCQKFSYFVLGLPCTPRLLSVTTFAELTTLVTVTLTLVHCCSSSLASRLCAINLVSKQMYHRIDVMLLALASSKYVTLIHLPGKPEFAGSLVRGTSFSKGG